MKVQFEKPKPDLRIRAGWSVPYKVTSYAITVNGHGTFRVDADEFDAAIKRARMRAETEYREYEA